MKENETRDSVLAVLESRRGGYVSGEALAQELKLSRTAVWKAIEALRGRGYRIRASSRRGYCLDGDNDLLSPQGIRPFLAASAQQYAERIHCFPVLASTNRTAKEMALSGAGHGTVLLADSQTEGRGRYARAFFSPPGGLYMSLILKSGELPFEEKTLVTALAAYGVCGAVEAVCGLQPGIKWVNDILLDGKKICGILTEAVTDFESGCVDWIVVGIGMNIHAREADFPSDLRGKAASIAPGFVHSGIRNHLAGEIINRILGEGACQRKETILEEYRKRLIMLGRRGTVSLAAESFEATAVDVDGEGRLLVRKENGEIRALSYGEFRMGQPKG